MYKALIIICLSLISCTNIRTGAKKTDSIVYFYKKDSLIVIKDLRFNKISTGKIIYDEKETKIYYQDDLNKKFLKYNYIYKKHNTDSLILVFNTNFKIQKEESYYINSSVEINSFERCDTLDVFRISKSDFKNNFRITHKPKYLYVCTFCNQSLNQINYSIPAISGFERLDTLEINLLFPDFIISSGLNYHEHNFNIKKITKKSVQLNSTEGVFINRKLRFKKVNQF
jgi:hypothetical protein